MEILLNKYYEKRLEPLLDDDKYCLNTYNDKVKNVVDDAPCILLLSSKSQMKIYSGPMLWNKIDMTIYHPANNFEKIIRMFESGTISKNMSTDVNDEQCLKFESEKAYFIFCCCWSNPYNCIYDPRTKLTVETNKQIWLELAKTHNPAFTLRMEAISFESDEKDIIPGLNEPLYYCSKLVSYDDPDSFTRSSITWKRIKIEEFPLRYRFCKFSISLHFQNNRAKRIEYVVKPDIENTCKRTQCLHNSPKCLTDILRAKTSLINSTCCCGSNLCSTWTTYTDYKDLNVKSKYFTILFKSCLHQSTTYLRISLSRITECVRNFDFRFWEEIFIDESYLITYTFGHKTVTVTDDTGNRKSLSCAIYQTYPVRDPYCHLMKNYESERSILQYYTCRCNDTSFLDGKKCDAGISSDLLLASSNWTRPTCFFTNITDHRLIYTSEKEISLYEGSEEETEEIPICAVAITISNSGLFYRFYKSRYSEFQEEVESKKRFFIAKRSNHTVYTTLCKSNKTTPCNNIQNLMLHNLRYTIRFHSKTKKPQSYHRCVISGGTNVEMKTENCSSATGCFTFTYHNSLEKLSGCVDKIPALVKTSFDLSPLLWCHQKTYYDTKYRCRAYKGITNVTASGTLCCCYKDCFTMTYEEHGFNPFESLL
ncbi:unnamed protein product [Cercopithifilaria johnstoni]|uniref:Uncharacterized protein n=1 Tax=Cercopithifilaria johnstoni TaxID=2874296 RepID=A0A8J2Q8F4_9BILA|nr:unnamed protein product [Cercopithifilaria johnstoni]